MKLCRNCKHFAWPLGGQPICIHPNAVLTADPVLGGKTYLFCAIMRGDGPSTRCGTDGIHFEELEGLGDNQRRGELLDQRTQTGPPGDEYA